MIVRLSQPPLAAWNADRSLSSATTANRLNLRSASSKAYLSQLASAQSAAVAQVRAAIPRAQIEERYSILLDGFAVRLPAKALPKLLGVRGVTKLYPSLSYYSTMDRGPSVIEASGFEAATGDEGQGMKIGVVDTGVDPSSPFLKSAGFSLPARLPEGRQAHDDAEGDRRHASSPAGARPEEQSGLRQHRAARHARVRHRGRRRGHERARRPRPSRDREPLRRCAEGVDRQLPRLRRADAARPPGEHAGDRARVRVGGRRRHERHQLLRRRPADRPGERRDVRGRCTTSRSPASSP